MVLTTNSVSASNGDLVSSIDLSGYTTILLQITGTWAGTLTFQGSNDNVNWTGVQGVPTNGSGTVPSSATTANAAFLIPVQARYFRARMTVYTSGTLTGAGVAMINGSVDQGARQVTVNNSVLPTGAATSANQSTEISSLATIVTNTTGAATAANQTNVQSAVGTAATTAITIQGSSSGVSVPTNARQTGTLTDRSGTTSGTASTSTQVAAANTSRKYFIIQNVSTTATIWVNFTSAATATQPSIQLLPGGSFVMEAGYVSTEAINVLSTTASVAYTAKEG